MINSLTKEQEQQVQVYLNKWLTLGKRTETMDKDKAKDAMTFLYSLLNIPMPKDVRYVSSPKEANLLIHKLKGKTDKDKVEYEYFTRTILWVGYYGFYDYVLNELFPEKRKDFTKFLEFLEHSKNFFGCYLFNEVAIICDFPQEININAQGQLHADGKGSMIFRDGYSLYHLNGIAVPKQVALVNKEDITAEMITKEQNADVRREIIRKVGAANLDKLVKSNTLDELDEYKLVSFDVGDGRVRPFIKMICPSTKLTHILGTAPEIKTCKNAMAFVFSQKIFKRPIKEDSVDRSKVLSLDSFEEGEVVFRHGDVNFKKYTGEIKEIESLKTSGVIHKGNNNNHEYVSGLFDIQEVNGKKIVVLLDECVIGHNEHGSQVHPPGTYEVSIAREYDHFLEESRQVID